MQGDRHTGTERNGTQRSLHIDEVINTYEQRKYKNETREINSSLGFVPSGKIVERVRALNSNVYSKKTKSRDSRTNLKIFPPFHNI